jgi:rhamnosyltransferase
VNAQKKLAVSHWSSVSAVVVTYQPDEAILDNLRKLSEQIVDIVVVDNASDGVSAKWVESAGRLPGVTLIRNSSNLGIATALNIGICHALQTGRQWVATFDQDTLIPPRYFEQLFEVYELCPARQNAGMIAPGHWSWSELNHTSAAKKYSTEPAWSFVRAALNSGSLIKTEVFESAGLYEDGLFLDYVDVEFCLRLQKKGFKILSATPVVLQHELGIKQTRNLLGFHLSFRIHAAWRYYYIMRNRVVLYRRYFGLFPLWVLQDVKGLLLEMGRIIFLENGRRQKLHAVFQGVRDGLRGNTGRHPNFPSD